MKYIKLKNKLEKCCKNEITHRIQNAFGPGGIRTHVLRMTSYDET